MKKEYITFMSVLPDIYSGRPNPTWELFTEQITEFHKKVSNLKTIEKFASRDDDGLGSRVLQSPILKNCSDKKKYLRLRKVE